MRKFQIHPPVPVTPISETRRRERKVEASGSLKRAHGVGGHMVTRAEGRVMISEVGVESRGEGRWPLNVSHEKLAADNDIRSRSHQTDQCIGSLDARLLDSYTLGAAIGEGHTASVRVCRNVYTGEKLACKSISKTYLEIGDRKAELEAEIVAMKRLRGVPHVVELRGLYGDENAVHLVMEYCPDGDLFDFLAKKRRLPEQDAARLLRQMALALQSCHDRNIIHRDFKPENVLISSAPMGIEGTQQPQVKLADFGLAALSTSCHQPCGSTAYMAPEVVSGFRYNEKIDTWSLGVTLFTALIGYLPFHGDTCGATLEAICANTPDFLSAPWPRISPRAKHIVKWMLATDPGRRASMGDVLTHPWIQRHCSRPPLTLLNRPREPSPPSSPSPPSAHPLTFPGFSALTCSTSPRSPAIRTPSAGFEDCVQYLLSPRSLAADGRPCKSPSSQTSPHPSAAPHSPVVSNSSKGSSPRHLKRTLVVSPLACHLDTSPFARTPHPPPARPSTEHSSPLREECSGGRPASGELCVGPTFPFLWERSVADGSRIGMDPLVTAGGSFSSGTASPMLRSGDFSEMLSPVSLLEETCLETARGATSKLTL